MVSYKDESICLKRALEECQVKIRELEWRDGQFKSILHSMNEAVERNLPDFTITYVNKAFCDFYGVTEEEVLGTNSMEWVLPEDRSLIKKTSKRSSPEQPDYHYTCRVRKLSGDIVWIEVFGRSFFDKKGNLIEYQDVSRDITQYKTAATVAEKYRTDLEERVRLRTLELSNVNQELQEANGYLQSTLNSISEGVISIDNRGNIIFLNYGANTLWYAKEDAISDKIKQDLADANSILYRLLYQKENFKNREISFNLPKGEIQCFASGVYIESDDVPLFDDEEKLRRCVLVLRPTSEVKSLVNSYSGSQARFEFRDIIGKSQAMRDTVQFAQRIAKSEGSIIIEGESGTGKELFAQAIHNESMRKKGPFIAVNCGAIPRDLIGSELFGYAEGAFTGAKKGGKPGKFELADGGTIFLDEIGDMPLEQQITLLRVLQERSVVRIGGNKEISVNVRIICATNKYLVEEVSKNNFREDLFYRLNVINIKIPPLRERKDDIEVLFKHFMRQLSNGQDLTIDPSIYDALMRYDWPGNVRELQNLTEIMFYLSDGKALTPEILPKVLKNSGFPVSEPPTENFALQEGKSLADLRNETKENMHSEERDTIIHLLEKHNYNASRVAREMGISRTTFYRKLHKYKLKQ